MINAFFDCLLKIKIDRAYWKENESEIFPRSLLLVFWILAMVPFFCISSFGVLVCFSKRDSSLEKLCWASS